MVIFLPEIIDINRVDQIAKKKINVQTFTNMPKLRKNIQILISGLLVDFLYERWCIATRTSLKAFIFRILIARSSFN